MRVEPVAVETPTLRGQITGRLEVALGLDRARVDGQLEVSRGEVVVAQRRYRLRRAVASFDGSLDPLLDVELERTLPQLTLIATITGRASDPHVTLSSEPDTYSQSQLLAIAMADNPLVAGDQTGDAAASLLAAIASQELMRAISPLLPVRLDVIAYQPASATSSRAFVFGRWITRRLLVLVRNRGEALANENVTEAEAEYWITPRLVVDGVAGDRTVLGLDLLWTRRW